MDQPGKAGVHSKRPCGVCGSSAPCDVSSILQQSGAGGAGRARPSGLTVSAEMCGCGALGVGRLLEYWLGGRCYVCARGFYSLRGRGRPVPVSNSRSSVGSVGQMCIFVPGAGGDGTAPDAPEVSAPCASPDALA
eukprot:scaffold16222_cov146-Isochrysis_galbana.AAC.1